MPSTTASRTLRSSTEKVSTSKSKQGARPKGQTTHAGQQPSPVTPQETPTSAVTSTIPAPVSDLLDTPAASGAPLTIRPSPNPPTDAPIMTTTSITSSVPSTASVHARTAFCLPLTSSSTRSEATINTSAASVAASKKKKKNSKSSKAKKDQTKKLKTSGTDGDELLALKKQVEQLTAEMDKQQKIDAASQHALVIEARIDKPKTKCGLQEAMQLVDNKLLYNKCRAVAAALCEQGLVDWMIDWRHQPHDRLSKVASQLAKRILYLQNFTHNWASYEILKTLLRNKRGYYRRKGKESDKVISNTTENDPQISTDVGNRAQRSGPKENDDDDSDDTSDTNADDDSDDDDSDDDDSDDDDLDGDDSDDSDSDSGGGSDSEGRTDEGTDHEDSEVGVCHERRMLKKPTKHLKKVMPHKASKKSKSKKRRRSSLISDDESEVNAQRSKKKSRRAQE